MGFAAGAARAWVDFATSRQIATSPPETNPDWREGYGFQFWMARHGFRGDGAYGQFCIVLPEQDAVVVITSATPAMQSVLDDVYAHLLPAFDGAASSSAADAALATRLAGLTLPLPAGADSPSDPARWDGLSFAPDNGVVFGASIADRRPRFPFRCRGRLAAHAWSKMPRRSRCSCGRPGPGRTRSYRLAVTPSRSPPRVPSAGDELRAEIRFLDTPHTLVLTLDPATLQFDGQWPTEPLHTPPLHRLRAPS